MGAPRKFGETANYVGFYVPKTLLERLDQETINLMEEFDGHTYTRSDLIRIALTEFLSRKDDARKRMRGRIRSKSS